jgi:O-antigen ligase
LDPIDRASIAATAAPPLLVLTATPDAMRLLAFSCIVALLLVDGLRRVLTGHRIRLDSVDFAFALLIGYAALSLCWSADWRSGVQAVILGVAAWLALAHVKQSTTQHHLIAFAWGIAAADCLVIARYYLMAPDQWAGFENRGYMAESLTLGLPFLLVLWTRRHSLQRSFAALVLVAVLLFLGFVSQSAIPLFVLVTLAIGLAIHKAFETRRLWGILASCLFTALSALIIIFAWEPLDLSRRLLIRLELMLDTIYMAAGTPVFGHGVGSFVALFPLFKESHLAIFPHFNQVFSAYTTEAEAAHNEFLQVAAELGLLGIVLLVFLFATIWRVARGAVRGDLIAAAGSLTLLAIAAASMIEYPLQRPATYFLALAAVAFVCHNRPPTLPYRVVTLPKSTVLPAALMLCSLAAGIVYAGYASARGDALFRHAQTAASSPASALAEALQAHTTNPLDRKIRVALPVFLDQVARADGMGAVAPGVVDALYEIAETGGPHSPLILIGRAQYLLNSGRADDPSLAPILADLENSAGRVPATYIIKARYALAHGDKLAAKRALERGRALALAAIDADPTASPVLRIIEGLEARVGAMP